MMIINQPLMGSIGSELQKLFSGNAGYDYDHFSCLVAYAKKSGVLRIKPFLEFFKSRGGKISIVVGIDQNNTSVDAVRDLHSICDDFYIYHNEIFTQTFHPKLYYFEKYSKEAIVFVGSSNLTAGGLYTNYEISHCLRFDLKDKHDRTMFDEYKNIFFSYATDKSKCCLRISDSAKIAELETLGYLKKESQFIWQEIRKNADTKKKRLFGSDKFVAPGVKISKPLIGKKVKIAAPELASHGFWKVLSNNDVSKTSSPGQIIIPIGFLGLFPTFTDWDVRDNEAMQADVYFNIMLEDETGDIIKVDNVRAIHYVPAPNHPRQNQEVRFTFHNKEVFDRLEAGDILEFRRTTNPEIWFKVRLLRRSSPDNRTLAASGKYKMIS